MKLAAIICEYNPFHTGHRFHIEKTRAAGATHVLCLMSGSVVQRGGLAVFSAQSRAREAVKNGADLVLELQPQISLAPARDFARGAVDVLNRLGAVDILSFGSETGSAEAVLKLCDEVKNRELEIKSLVSRGRTYPQAAAEILGSGAQLRPNDILAAEYLRALTDSRSAVEPLAIKRTAEHDGLTPDGSFASASYIRETLKNGCGAEKYLCGGLPDEEPCFEENAEKAILYRLSTMSAEDFERLPYCRELAPRLFEATRRASSLGEIYAAAKSRNFTLSRVRRAVFSAAIGLAADDFAPQEFARVLALNGRGAEILRVLRGAEIPVGSSLKRLSEGSSRALRQAGLIETASRLLSLGTPSGRGVSEFRRTVSAEG